MKTFIYCKPTAKGIHSFYVRQGNEEFYLFSQNYRKSVHDYYRNGVILNSAIDHSRGHGSDALERTMSKIPSYIRYIEKEYGVEILDRTKRQNKSRRLKCA